MARKNKKKQNTNAPSRTPIVTIKKRDEKLANDLQNMKQRDLIKYGSHLIKMISENAEYQDLIFNLPLLMHLMRRYELEKKPSGIKTKIFRQNAAKDFSQYLIPELADSKYVSRARAIIDKKFNSSDISRDDKMALAIARASVEMHGKTIQGIKITIAEVPLYQIALNASSEYLKKITKMEKQEKSLSLSEASKTLALFPRWNQDLQEYQNKLTTEMSSVVNDSKNDKILPSAATVLLQKNIIRLINQNPVLQNELVQFLQKRKLKTETMDLIKEKAVSTIKEELINNSLLIAHYLEKEIKEDDKENFSKTMFILYTYLMFMSELDMNLLLPVYIYQGILHANESNFSKPESKTFLISAKKAEHKEGELLNRMAAYLLGEKNGDHVLEMGDLFRSLKLIPSGREFYARFLDLPDSHKDKYHKKIVKDLEKNFK